MLARLVVDWSVANFGNQYYTLSKEKKWEDARIESPIGSHKESTRECAVGSTSKYTPFQHNGTSEATNCVAGRVFGVGWDRSKSYNSLPRDRWNEYKNRQVES
jgi:hypothetical protein